MVALRAMTAQQLHELERAARAMRGSAWASKQMKARAEKDLAAVARERERRDLQD